MMVSLTKLYKFTVILDGFPNGYADKVAQIKELQYNREAAESVLGRPRTISRNAQGTFDTYYIKVGETKEEAYIKYDDNGVITSLMRKQLPK